MDAPVLLTGATGYIGGRLLRHFEEAGRPVRCLARNPEGVRATRSTPHLSGLWLALVTPAQARVGRALVDLVTRIPLLPVEEA